MVKSTSQKTDMFKTQLAQYKQLIDEDIAVYAKELQKTTLQNYGANARLATDGYVGILERGGKRIRGSLVMVGYEMCGGTNRHMILQAARAVEMIHAYILIIDDIQDRSPVRRGGPTAHFGLADHHRAARLSGSAEHFGLSIALNSALVGNHDAQKLLANLAVNPALRNQVVELVNQTMIITAHGQTNDIMNEVVAEVDPENIERVLEWKTAHYSFLNPLQVGMVLAGASESDVALIADYAMHTGKAFQITDDILGIFGTEYESGKSPLDDIKEGKRTILTSYALEHASEADKNFLIQMLGNNNLTQAEFKRCQESIINSGALDHSKQVANEHVKQAVRSLSQFPSNWSRDAIVFLDGLAEYLLVRTA